MFRSLVLLGLVAALSGCFGEGFPQLSGRGEAPAGKAPQKAVLLGSFNVEGPRGFCVDTGSVRERGGEAFAVLGSCSAISGNPKDAKPKMAALLTVSVTAVELALDAGALDQMTAFLSTETGREMVARKGAGAATILDLSRGENHVLVLANDGGGKGKLSDTYWRAIFAAGGRLVSATASTYRGQEGGSDAARALLEDLMTRLRRANPAPGEANSANPLADWFNRLP
ncbi:MAG: hypothetical protein CR993_05040 [Rhodobacterales bacterium]|nr:MAG: hypothetical protein CR993_05040 [Rhodobacterales bacterium]